MRNLACIWLNTPLTWLLFHCLATIANVALPQKSDGDRAALIGMNTMPQRHYSRHAYPVKYVNSEIRDVLIR